MLAGGRKHHHQGGEDMQLAWIQKQWRALVRRNTAGEEVIPAARPGEENGDKRPGEVAGENRLPAKRTPSPDGAVVSGCSANWQVKEPPADALDPVPHTEAQTLAYVAGWRVFTASRRGKAHAHEGKFREDAVRAETEKGWILMAVADGGGSYALARVGAHLCVKTAISSWLTSLEAFSPQNADTLSVHGFAGAAMNQAVQAVLKALEDEARCRACPVSSLSSTLLLTACHIETGTVAAFQTGDGLMAGTLDRDGVGYRTVLLGTPDVGAYSGETVFMPGLNPDQCVGRMQVRALGELSAILLASDGLADDLTTPFPKGVGLFVDEFRSTFDSEKDSSGPILEWLAYEKRGSADDRTFALALRN
jgi:serine/threonine protein phosphatase PrpC